MAAKSRKKNVRSARPLLDKIWWATLPVVIATQSLVGEVPAKKSGAGTTRIDTPHLWSLEDDYKEISRQVLLKALNQTLHEAATPQYSQRIDNSEQKDHVDIDWFAKEKASNNRFQLPDQLAKECTSPQSCGFDPKAPTQPTNQRNYLSKQQLVQRAAAAAATLYCNAPCEASSCESPSCATDTSSSWCQDNYAKRDTTPSAKAKVPALLSAGSDITDHPRPSYVFVARSSQDNVSNRHVEQPHVSEISHIPEYLNAPIYQLDSGIAAGETPPQQHFPLTAGLTEACPHCPKNGDLTPTFLVAGNVTAVARHTHAFADQDQLNLKLILASSSALSDLDLAASDRINDNVRDIPYLACEGCHITSGQAGDENRCPIGACDASVLGFNRESEDILNRVDNPITTSIAHLEEPLTDGYNGIAHQHQEDPTNLWVSAPATLSLLSTAESSDCIGADCNHQIGPLTEGHPTAALVAFDNKQHRTISDIGHLSLFSCSESVATDPRFYCQRDPANEPKDLADSLQGASKVFLALTREQAHLPTVEPRDISRDIPNGGLWGSIQKLSAPVPDQIFALADDDLEQAPLSQEIASIATSEIHSLPDGYYYFISEATTPPDENLQLSDLVIPVETSVALSSDEGISSALARADLRTGQQKPKIVKVVDATVPHKSLSLAGKPRNATPQTSAEDNSLHRFAVEVVPHIDPNATPSMQLLVGPTRTPRPEAQPQRSGSLFIDFAHAAGVRDNNGSYEPSSFLSVGAPPAHHQDNHAREGYAVGASSWNDDDDIALADEETLTRGEPGIDPYTRQPTGLGVRREGHLWDNNKPWLAEENNSQPSQNRSSSDKYGSTPRFKEERPPDKDRNTLWNRAHPIALQEAPEQRAGEANLPLQKKNRQIEFEDESPQDSPSGIQADTEADLPTTAFDQSDDEFYEDDAGEEPFVSGWEQERSNATLEPTAQKRDLSPRKAIDKSIAQDTLFDSGFPSPKDKTSEALQKEHPEEKKEHEGLLINFRDVGMTEYIRFVAQQTGKNFVFNDDDLQFNITIISEQPTALENILAALLQELRIHGLQVIEQGNNIIIHKNDKTRGPVNVFQGDQSHPEAQLVTRVFQLRSIPAEKMREIVVPMLSGQALVQVLADTNNLLITDFSNNVSKIADLIHSLDVPTTAYEIGQYAGRNNFIENLIPLAEEIVKPFTEKQNIIFVPHLATNSVFIVSTPLLVKRAISILERLDTAEGGKALTPEEHAKGINVTNQLRPGERLEHETEAETRTRLEREATERQSGGGNGPQDLLPHGAYKGQREAHQQPRHEEPLPDDHISQTKFYIHKLQSRQGDELQDALSRIADSLRLSEKANIDLVNAINSIQWIDSSNSLVVTGTADALARVKELIDEIDIPLRQILLEMLILDTTISDSLTYAVDFASEFNGVNVAAAQGFSGGQPTTTGSTNTIGNSTTPLLTAVNRAAGTAADAVITAASLAGVSTPGFNLGIIGRRILKGGLFFNTMGGLVQAVHGDTNTEVVLNPKIIVEDNNEAEIFVGETIAFQTQNVVNDTGTIVSQNFEFRDVGTRLKVRPQIGNNNVITLEIEEEVSATITAQSSSSGGGGGTSGSANISPGPSTSTSRTITKVHVPDGFFVVLSGMIRDQKDRNREQVPCLGGIPIIGAFCSRKDNAYSKRNLMIFIRPQIIENDWDWDDITKRQQNIYKDKSRMRPRWKFEADEGLDFLNLPRLNERCEDGGYLPGYRDEDAPDCPYQTNWRY